MFRRSRNAGAIAALFADHFDPIYRFASRRVGRDVATDIAAETFAQALRSIDRMDPARDARPWLFGIANNVIRHHHRAEKRRLRAYAALERQSDVAGPNGHPESETLMRASLVVASPLVVYGPVEIVSFRGCRGVRAVGERGATAAGPGDS
jgi:RNA polymerase sigma-70 factor (ECF subfamily)